MKERDILHFIDNDGVREALVRGATRSIPNLRMLAMAARLEVRAGMRSWYTRVPSESNLADGPSRLNFDVLTRWPGATLQEPVWPDLRELQLEGDTTVKQLCV